MTRDNMSISRRTPQRRSLRGPCDGAWRRSRRPCEQCAQADHVVGRCRKCDDPIDACPAAMPKLAQPANRFQPAEDLLDQLALLLADCITGMTRGPIVDAAARDLLRDVWRHTQRAHAGDKARDVESFVPANGRGDWASASNSKAASRSAVPVALVTHTLATRPWRLSSRTLPAYDSFASLPGPFRASMASGSVVDCWVSFRRDSPWKLIDALDQVDALLATHTRGRNGLWAVRSGRSA
jgi:ferredoxin